MNYIKILRYWAKGDKTLFDIPAHEQRNFLNSLRSPKNDIDRGFKQYLCQNYYLPLWKKVFANAISLCVFPITTLWFVIKRCFIKKKGTVSAIGDFKGFEEVLPQKLRDKYQIDNNAWMNCPSLSVKDVLFIMPVFFKNIIHPFFLFKCMMKIAMYSSMIKRCNPFAIIVHNEYSFTSSVLTAYCRKKGVKHINVMHGEKLYFIRDSFFIFDECYVWNEYYIDLFKKLRAYPNQFVVAVPPSLKINDDSLTSEKYFAYYKYYLAEITKEKMHSIVRSMEFAEREGRTVKYRPHPRYTNIALLESVVGKENIEYPQKVSIEHSIANMQVAIGSYTTVLNQAINSKKEILLDDVTYKDQYDKLADLMYIFANKKYAKLSEKQTSNS